MGKIDDTLLVELISMCKIVDYAGEGEQTYALLLEGIYNLTEEDEPTRKRLTKKIDAHKRELSPGCFTCTSPCGRASLCDLAQVMGYDSWQGKWSLFLSVKAKLDEGLGGVSMALHGKTFLYTLLFLMGENISQKRLDALQVEYEMLDKLC